MAHPQHLPVLEITRGDTLESIHSGSVAVSDPVGNLVAWFGDPATITYLRSSAKPFQALPFFETGGKDHYALTGPEIALICASHSGTDQHVAVARQIQAKAGVKEIDLLCGIHPPYDEATLSAMRERGEEPTPNRHNCSGKHTGMLAFAKLQGWTMDDYIDLAHPVQQGIIRSFAEMCGLGVDEVKLGIDGCSAPNFAVPLRNAARAIARLMDPTSLPARRAEACRLIVGAMTSNPGMVAGPGRFDTALMETIGGRLLAKSGTEGYQAIGIPAGALKPGSPALGIALKIADGDGRGKSRAAFTLAVLQQLGALSPQELVELDGFGPKITLNNWRRIPVGQAQPCFQLNFPTN